MNEKPFELTVQDRIAILEAAKEIDLQVAQIDRGLTTSQRAQKAFSLCNMVMEMSIYRLRQEQPELSVQDAQRLFLQRYYELESRRYGETIS